MSAYCKMEDLDETEDYDTVDEVRKQLFENL